MNNELKLFNALMTYLKSMGSIAMNVDMDRDEIEFFDGKLFKSNGRVVKLSKIFDKFLIKLCVENANEMWESTGQQETFWVIDMTIDPISKEIILQTKYLVDVVTEEHTINWDWQDVPLKEVYYISDIFEANKNVEEIHFECLARQTYEFGLNSVILKYKDGREGKVSFNDWALLQTDIMRLLKFKIIGVDKFNSMAYEEGFKTTIVCGREEDTSYINIEEYGKETKKGKRIVIDKNYFETENINENQTEMDFNDKDEIFKGYIDIKEPEDSNSDNLNIESIQKNTRFAKMLNTILYELYDDNLGMNDDKSKYGIVDIYPLNEFTSWSILNYFGGHKFVKQRLLDRFNKTSEGKTPKDFYRWLIENKENLLKDGPVLKELIRTNFNTYNKGSITEKYVIDKLKDRNFDVKYYPPGSKYDREYGVDLEINGKLYQIKELTGVSKKDDKILIHTPLPKNYLGLKVQKIMLVDIKNGEFISFPNKNYSLDVSNKCYVINIEDKKEIKSGNLNNI